MMMPKKDMVQELVEDTTCNHCGKVLREPSWFEKWATALYVGSRFANVALLFLFLAMFAYTLSVSEQNSQDLYNAGNINATIMIAKNHESALYMYSILPLMCVSMAMIGLVSLR